MGSTATDILSKTDPWFVFMIIFGLLFMVQQTLNLVKSLEDHFGIEKRGDIEKREIKKSISELAEELKKSVDSLSDKIEDLKHENEKFKIELKERNDEFKETIDNITTATREELGDKINSKFKKYFELGYIPADEFDEFVNLHNAYKLVGGNHTGDIKYEKCINLLNVQDDSKPEMQL